MGAAVVGLLTYEVPRTTPAGSRVVAEAARPTWCRPISTMTRGAVAALGPVRTWKVAPQVPAGFGFLQTKEPGP